MSVQEAPTASQHPDNDFLNSLCVGDIWGKSKGYPVRYPLLGHLVDTAACISAMWEVYISQSVKNFLSKELKTNDPQDVLNILRYAGALHDIGKCGVGFQSKDNEVEGGFRSNSVSIPNHGSFNFHALDSALITERELKRSQPTPATSRDNRRAERSNEMFAKILDGHHGTWSSKDKCRNGEDIADTALEHQQTIIFDLVTKLIWGGTPWLPDMVGNKYVAVIMTGIVSLADWIASSKAIGSSQCNDSVSVSPEQWSDLNFLKDHEYQAITKAKELLPKIGLTRWRMEDKPYKERFDQDPLGIQSSLEAGLKGKSGLLFITAPTGGGKTDAAWSAAHSMGSVSGSGGVFFGLPTMVTADGIYSSIIQTLKRTDKQPEKVVTRTHSLSGYMPLEFENAKDKKQRERSEWMNTSQKALLAPVSIGTVDQALQGAVVGKQVGMRLFGLSQKVVVIDEAHAFSSYMNGILSRLVEWLGRTGTPIIVMSATLPQNIIDSISESYLVGVGGKNQTTRGLTFSNPGWMLVGNDGTITRSGHDGVPKVPVADDDVSALKITLLKTKPTNIEEALVNASTKKLLNYRHGNILVVCNTVGRSQNVWSQIKDIVVSSGLNADVQLLHSRFPRERRTEMEKTLRKRMGSKTSDQRPKCSIMVATQVVEQSLDIDFDLVVTDLAPISFLIQRAGRAHRNVNRDKLPGFTNKEVIVVCPSNNGKTLNYSTGTGKLPDQFIYEPILLHRTFDYIQDQLVSGKLSIPYGLKEAVDAIHLFPDDEKQCASEEDIVLFYDDLDEKSKASLSSIPCVDNVDDFSKLSSMGRKGDDPLFNTGTRGDIDSEWILPVWKQNDTLYLDPECTDAIPLISGTNDAKQKKIKHVIDHVVPSHGKNVWVKHRVDERSKGIGVYERADVKNIMSAPILTDLNVVVFSQPSIGLHKDKVCSPEVHEEQSATLSSLRGLILPRHE